jgi:hypothetical protein
MNLTSGFMELPDRYPIYHSRVFDQQLHFNEAPLAVGGSGQSYIAISETGKKYFVKMASSRIWTIVVLSY